MRNPTRIALLCALYAPLAISAADTICYSDSVALTTTNWADTMDVPKFDPDLGTLDSVSVTLGGVVWGDASFESLDAAPSTVTMNLMAKIELFRPDNSLMVVTLPLTSTSDSVTAFDGIIDFGGSSGRSYSNLSGTDSDLFGSSSPADLVLFTGPGAISLPVKATGASNGSGNGNLLLLFHTSAAAEVEVCYNYTVPEPTTFGLVAAGLAGLFARRRR